MERAWEAEDSGSSSLALTLGLGPVSFTCLQGQEGSGPAHPVPPLSLSHVKPLCPAKVTAGCESWTGQLDLRKIPVGKGQDGCHTGMEERN